MSSGTPVISSDPFWKPIWSYSVLFGASGAAIIPVYRHYVLKSDLQKGVLSPTLLPFGKGMQMGIKAAPSTSLAVGLPLLMQRHVEPWFQGEEKKTTWRTLILSAAVVGALSTPILLVFEGNSLRQGVLASLKHISCPKQYLAFSVQEVGCVAGLSAAKHVDGEARKYFNIQENALATYGSAFISGSAGAIAGHVGNTVSTRLRHNLSIDYRSISQLGLGLVPRARALGWYSVAYHLICNTLLQPTR
jgi:hypothetical protein